MSGTRPGTNVTGRPMVSAPVAEPVNPTMPLPGAHGPLIRTNRRVVMAIPVPHTGLVRCVLLVRAQFAGDADGLVPPVLRFGGDSAPGALIYPRRKALGARHRGARIRPGCALAENQRQCPSWLSPAQGIGSRIRAHTSARAALEAVR